MSDLHNNIKDVVKNNDKQLKEEAEKVDVASANGRNESIEGILKAVYEDVGKKTHKRCANMLIRWLKRFTLAKSLQT